MADRKRKAWELPFSFRDPIMGIDMTVDRYDLDSGGSGIQVTFSGGVGPVAVRVPMERAVGLAMKILAGVVRDAGVADPAGWRAVQDSELVRRGRRHRWVTASA